MSSASPTDVLLQSERCILRLNLPLQFCLSSRAARSLNETDSRQILICSTHLMGTLLDDVDGLNQASRWMENRNINVFEKKLIFLPVPQGVHWLLVVVINPGKVMEVNLDEDDGAFGMIYLDSLGCRPHYRSVIMDFLNQEWKRLKADTAPFNFRTFKYLTPGESKWTSKVASCLFADCYDIDNSILFSAIDSSTPR